MGLLGWIAALVAFGSVWFWLIMIAAFCGIAALVENEEGVWATLVMVLTAVTLNWVWKVPIFKTCALHPWKALLWVLVYFVAGALWGLFKWWLYAHKQLAAYKELRDEFMKSENVTELTPALALKLKSKVGMRAEAPSVSQHKCDITRWMTYWPFSVVGTLLNDFVRKAWNYIYVFMATTYDRISKHVFRKYEADVLLAKQGAVEEEAKRAETTDLAKSGGVGNRSANRNNW
jgi:hypothetical protein